MFSVKLLTLLVAAVAGFTVPTSPAQRELQATNTPFKVESYAVICPSLIDEILRYQVYILYFMLTQAIRDFFAKQFVVTDPGLIFNPNDVVDCLPSGRYNPEGVPDPTPTNKPHLAVVFFFTPNKESVPPVRAECAPGTLKTQLHINIAVLDDIEPLMYSKFVDNFIRLYIQKIAHHFIFNRAVFQSADYAMLTQISKDPNFNKYYVKTPGMLALARAHFNCPDMTEIELETDDDGLLYLNSFQYGPEILAGKTGTLITKFFNQLFQDTGKFTPIRGGEKISHGLNRGCGFQDLQVCSYHFSEYCQYNYERDLDTLAPIRFKCNPTYDSLATCDTQIISGQECIGNDHLRVNVNRCDSVLVNV